MAPLEGLKVIELARILAGPWAGQTLADLGAEVIKIESPEGDDTRRWGPPFIDGKDGSTAAYFHSCNRGKSSVVADLKSDDGRALVCELAGQADVLIENFKVGALAKYKLDYSSLSALNPRLIYCSITGFGQTGPYKNRAGYDYVIQGMSGLMSFTGEPDGQPMKTGVAITDLFTGLYSVIAIQAAIAQREKTGRGQHIDMSLLDCATSVTANQALNYLSTGRPPERLGNAHPNLMPYQVFACSDGWVIISVGNDRQFRSLCRVLQRNDLETDAAFATNDRRIGKREHLTQILQLEIEKWTKLNLLAACEKSDVPAGPINNLAEVFDDPQVIARALQIRGGDVPGVRSPISFSDADLVLEKSAPELGSGEGKFRADQDP